MKFFRYQNKNFRCFNNKHNKTYCKFKNNNKVQNKILIAAIEWPQKKGLFDRLNF